MLKKIIIKGVFFKKRKNPQFYRLTRCLWIKLPVYLHRNKEFVCV